MSRIFLSHSSTDNLAARALGDWLKEEGWDDVFLDIDSQTGIAPGERWERRLHEAANRCEAVIFLISQNWLDSDWCRREFHLARKLNKRLFGVLIEDRTPASLPEELRDTWQLCNLAAGTDHRMFSAVLPDGREGHVTFSADGLARLKEGLTRAGLDARFFAWPPESDRDRLPYRGLAPLEAEDAGIFFGREAPTVEAMDTLRGLSEAAPPRIVAILGASGAGKSSFLRAGLLPRLVRDEQAFLVLPIVRPRRAAITGESGLLAALERGGARRSRNDLRRIVSDGGEPLADLLAGLQPSDSHAALVLPVDQAEELFAADGGDEANLFLRRLRELAEQPRLKLIVLLTIRSDAYDRLQNAAELDGIALRPFNLSPMPRGAYQTVIEGPAERYVAAGRKLRIDPKLTAALLSDLEQGGGKDALPLLAFTLERLLAEYGGDGDLTLSEYQGFGGIAGAIDDAVGHALQAADGDAAVPRDKAARLALLRRGLIPWLAGIDPVTNAPRRKVALWSDIPAEAQPLMQHLVDARLLAADVDAEGRQTVEPAHEALLRQWGALKGWLEEDLAVLSTLDGVKDAARDWAANNRDAAFLVHAGSRLAAAEGLNQRPDLAANLGPRERDYLGAARAAEDARRNRELRQARQLARRTFMGLAVALVLLAIAIGVGFYALQQRDVAEQSRVAATDAAAQQALAAKAAEEGATIATYNETVGLDAMSESARLAGRTRDAVALALAAWPRVGETRRPMLERTLRALSLSLPFMGERKRIPGRYTEAYAPVDGSYLLLETEADQAEIWDPTGTTLLRTIGPVQTNPNIITTFRLSADGKRLMLRSSGVATNVYDTQNGDLLLETGPESAANGVGQLSADGRRALIFAQDGSAQIWDIDRHAPVTLQRATDERFTIGAFSPDGQIVVTTSLTDYASWDAATGRLIKRVTSVPKADQSFDFLGVIQLAFLDDHRVVLGGTKEGVTVWDARSGTALGAMNPCAAPATVVDVDVPSTGRQLLATCSDLNAFIYDAATLKPGGPLQGQVSSATYTADGTLIAGLSGRTELRAWDAATGQLVMSLKREGMASLAVLGRDMATVTVGSDAWIWNTSARTRYRNIGSAGRYNSWVDITPDGKSFLTATGDNQVLLVPLDGSPVERLGQGFVWFARLSADGNTLLTGMATQGVAVFERHGTKLVSNIAEPRLQAAALSPDGSLIAVTTQEGKLKLWNRDGTLKWETDTIEQFGLSDVAFSPDGRRIAAAPLIFGVARVWDTASGKLVSTYTGSARLSTVAFSADGTRVVSAGSAAGIVWNPETGAEELRLPGPNQALSAHFAGDRIVTTDGTSAIVWDAATGIALGAWGAQPGWANIANVTPDGRTIITVSRERSEVRTWDISALPQGDAMALACTALGDTGDIADVAAAYGLKNLEPICASGHEPQPVELARLAPAETP